jgi:hypothetical protein
MLVHIFLTTEHHILEEHNLSEYTLQHIMHDGKGLNYNVSVTYTLSAEIFWDTEHLKKVGS